MVRTLEGHEADIRFITLSPDSARLASVASNGEVNLWDLSPGLQENERLSATFRAPERWADFARLLPDGRLLVGGSAGMLIYPTDVDGLLRLARRLRYLLDPQRPGRDDTARCPTLP